jgi:hydrogenase maturation protein HypF
MAEHGVPPGEAILAFVWDGTGYGDDGAIWGGEALHCTYAACTRVAHLRYVPLPGGDAAIRKPYRAALAHLHSAGIEWANAATHMTAISPQEAHLLARQLDTGYNCVATSSMGRLIDAAAALCGMAAVVSYEAQAAIELEAQIPPALRPQPGAVAPYPFPLLPDAGSLSQWDPCPLLRALLADLQAGVAPGIIAARTLAGLAHGLLAVAEQQRRLVPGRRIGISGGVFQNRWLSQYVTALLEQAGFSLLRHRLVPANDGCDCLGCGGAGRQSCRRVTRTYGSCCHDLCICERELSGQRRQDAGAPGVAAQVQVEKKEGVACVLAYRAKSLRWTKATGCTWVR